MNSLQGGMAANAYKIADVKLLEPPKIVCCFCGEKFDWSDEDVVLCEITKLHVCAKCHKHYADNGFHVSFADFKSETKCAECWERCKWSAENVDYEKIKDESAKAFNDKSLKKEEVK